MDVLVTTLLDKRVTIITWWSTSMHFNIDTGEVISVNTNMIEGAWKHAKV